MMKLLHLMYLLHSNLAVQKFLNLTTLPLHVLLCSCISYFAPAYLTLLLHILLCSCISYFAPAYPTLLLHILLCSCICYFAPAYATLLLHIVLCSCMSYFTPACRIVAFFLDFPSQLALLDNLKGGRAGKAEVRP